MSLREKFKKETGLNSLESVLCDCGQTVDVWNDKYIIWLETELKNTQTKLF